jgi:pyruvate/2-oxoglutarate dehydrogenase complex dihydrolipoamide dehydrogenase (E3) component
MGTQVTLVEHNGRLLPRVDADAGTLLSERLEGEGIDVIVNADVRGVEPGHDGVLVALGSGQSLEAERVLVATGRVPNVEGLGLEQLGAEITPRGLKVDDRLRAAEGVWAIGDVSGVGVLTSAEPGARRGRQHRRKNVRADYRAIPAAVFTDHAGGERRHLRR